MLAFLFRRLGQSVLVVAVMATLVFVGVYALGNPIDILINPEADQLEREQAIVRLGLDRPMWVQFALFVKAALTGDLGISFVHGVPAAGLILSRMPATLELAMVALVIAIGLGIPLGVIAGAAPHSLAGRGIMTASIIGFSLPNFWLGLMLILAFAVELQVLPAGGRGATRTLFGIEWSLLTVDGLRHLILPALTLAIYKASLVVRLAYAGTREAMLQDFVRFARAKGLSRSRIIGVHVLKTILIPVVTVIGLELGSMIAFAVVTETVFAWPGMGKLLIESIYRLDRPVIVAYLIIVVLMFVLINLVVDVIYTLLDPRVRLAGEEACWRCWLQKLRRARRPSPAPGANLPKAASPSRRSLSSWFWPCWRWAPHGSRRRTPTTSRSSTSWTICCRRAAAASTAGSTCSAPTTRAATSCRRSSMACA
jgi:peptide/nickel transport system permease protein